MNLEDLKPCPVCGMRCSIIEMNFDLLGFRNGDRMGVWNGTFKCSYCGSIIKLHGDNGKRIFDKWNNLARNEKAVQDAT